MSEHSYCIEEMGIEKIDVELFPADDNAIVHVEAKATLAHFWHSSGPMRRQFIERDYATLWTSVDEHVPLVDGYPDRCSYEGAQQKTLKTLRCMAEAFQGGETA